MNGLQSVRATMTNAPNDSETFTDIEPRLGATYTIGAHDVVRFNYGRYTQAPNTSLEQPSVLQQDLASADARDFYPAGFTSTTHRVTPPTADDVDASWQHDFGAGTNFDVTPFLRRTHDQIQNFSLNARTGFNSGLNAADQTSDGVELQVDRERSYGLGGLLSLTFTHSSVRYDSLGNGGSVLGTIDLAIQEYNSFTSACRNAIPSTNPNAPCGTFGNANAIATESNGVANPYFNAPAQQLLDLGGSYLPFDAVPGNVEADPASYETPLSAALVLTYRPEYLSKWRFAPQFQYFAGGYYGDQLTGWGVNPAACSALNGAVAGDPRYPYGGSGLPYDAQSCFGRLPVPDPYTHKFDGMGAFRGPNR
ncbi:MAG TPA: hypothetical protein VKT80_11625, partial [Chloroflexota bacterium]|nr:hypothetical protein [Chloroflexota bacterium]